MCVTGWGHSSVGRASRSQCEGLEFDPPWLHHFFHVAREQAREQNAVMAGKGKRAPSKGHNPKPPDALQAAMKLHQGKVEDPRKIRKLYERKSKLGKKGKSSWQVLLGYTNKRKVKVTLGADRKFANHFKTLWNQSIDDGNVLPLSLLQENAMLDVRWATNTLKRHGVTLREAVEFFIKHQVPAGRQLKFKEAMKEYYEIQRHKQLSETSSSEQSTNYKTYFKPLVDFFDDTLLTNITAKDVKRYLKHRGKDWSDGHYNHHLNRGRAFWNTMAKAKFCKTDLNPWSDDVLPRKVVKGKRTTERILSPEDVQKFFWFVEDKADKRDKTFYRELALLTLTYFAGVRVNEVSRLEWVDIDTKHKPRKGRLKESDETTWRVTVWNDVEKTNRTKVNPIPENAKHWLNKCLRVAKEYSWKKIAPVDSTQRLKRLRARFKKETGISLPQNAARHSFCNYHLSQFNSTELTVKRLNHGSVSTMNQHYKATTDPDLAETFFSILPRKTHDKQQLVNIKAYKKLMAKKGVEGKQEIEFFTSLQHGHEKCWMKFFTSKGVEEFVAQEAWDEGSTFEYDGVTYQQTEIATLVKFNRYKQTLSDRQKRNYQTHALTAKFSFKDVTDVKIPQEYFQINDAAKMLSIEDFIVEQVDG